MNIPVSQVKFDQANELQNEKLDRLLSKQGDLITAVNNLSSEIQELKNEALERDRKIAELERSLEEQKQKNSLLERQMLLIEVKERSSNLIIHGLPTDINPNQSLEAHVKDLLKNTLKIESSLSINKCYRLGGKTVNITNRRRNQSQTRKPAVNPVLIRLRNEAEAYLVMQNVSKLKGSGIRICTDLPPALNTLRTGFLTKAKEMKESGMIIASRVKNKGTHVWLEIKKNGSVIWERADQ